MKKKDRLRDLSPVDIHLVLTFEWYEWLTDARNAKSIARLKTSTNGCCCETMSMWRTANVSGCSCIEIFARWYCTEATRKQQCVGMCRISVSDMANRSGVHRIILYLLLVSATATRGTSRLQGRCHRSVLLRNKVAKKLNVSMFQCFNVSFLVSHFKSEGLLKKALQPVNYLRLLPFGRDP